MSLGFTHRMLALVDGELVAGGSAISGSWWALCGGGFSRDRARGGLGVKRASPTRGMRVGDARLLLSKAQTSHPTPSTLYNLHVLHAMPQRVLRRPAAAASSSERTRAQPQAMKPRSGRYRLGSRVGKPDGRLTYKESRKLRKELADSAARTEQTEKESVALRESMKALQAQLSTVQAAKDQEIAQLQGRLRQECIKNEQCKAELRAQTEFRKFFEGEARDLRQRLR